VFADRYHDRVLRTPREVRVVLVYVLRNARKHQAEGLAIANVTGPIDLYSSAPWFDGWQITITVRGAPACPVTSARTWLLKTGWRRHGLLAVG
jgi:putative transposase